MIFTRNKIPMNNPRLRCRRLLGIAVVSVLLASCEGGSGSGDANSGGAGTTGGGGIIGTGIRLEGTASSVRRFASNNVEIKARSGEKASAEIGATGRFQTSMVGGEGPFLLRADMGNNEYLYSIGHKNADGTLTQNIHSYTDVAARNWFASNGMDIDAAFTGNVPILELPNALTATSIINGFLAIVSDVLFEYDIPDTNLATVSYDANNTGVDFFLRNNPVLINNGAITILVTDPDPDSRIITQASSDIDLATDLTMVDTVAPSAPASVRALAASMDEVIIVWESAIDNIGVTAYQVFRDGELITTTPFPVFTDTGLMANTEYSYTVVAIDSSGNPSVSSLAAVSETLQLADTLAPPMPVSVVLEPGLNTIAVNWSQAEVFDVAAFNVYRSGTADQADAVFKVTSTFMTDATVFSGSQYCYQVSAEDASGNESDLSPIECAVTSGSQVSAPATPQTGLLAPTVDVSGISCTTELTRTVSSDSVIAAGCYLAPDGIVVRSGANLTIEPGVIIKFGSTERFEIHEDATLTAVGTATSPIVLSATEALPGFWHGIDLSQSNSLRNQLDFVQVEYAGGSSFTRAGIFVSASRSPSRVSIKNTTVRFSLGDGFKFADGIFLEAFEGNLSTGNEMPVSTSVNIASALNGSSRYTGNETDAVLLTSDDVDTAATLAKLDVPYQTEGRILVENKLTIEAGATIAFASQEELIIAEEGLLQILGTAEEPVLLTGISPTPGAWGGVRILFDNKQANEIEHTVIEYAGGGSREAALTVLSFDISTSRLSASNVVLRDSMNDGFRIGEGAVLPKFDNITSTLNGRAGVIDTNAVHQIGPGGSFVGNVVDHIFVNAGTIEEDVTWLAHDVPYLVENATGIQHTLTLSPGTTLLMDSGAELEIGTDGTLIAVGTALNPIIITGAEQIPGYWESVAFFRSHSPDNRMEHVVVEYGGGSFTAGNGGNVTMRCVTNDPTRLTIANVEFNFSRDWGIRAAESGCEVTLGDNVTYSGNGIGGFNLMP